MTGALTQSALSTVEGLQGAHRLDAEHFDEHWRHLFTQGKIALTVPPDEVMWQQDLGRSLQITFDWLGDLQGKRILELGCGPGDYTIMFARRGAHVTALDIAPASLEITQERAQANHVSSSIHLTQMAAETLGLPDHTFDWVIGLGLLHHADPVALGPELRRVLHPGGRALFREPLGTNPLLEFARRHLPYRGKHHTRNEHPLKYTDINQIAQSFRAVRVREFYLFSMISRAVGSETSLRGLWYLDEFLIRHFPVVRRWCRYILVEYVV